MKHESFHFFRAADEQTSTRWPTTVAFILGIVAVIFAVTLPELWNALGGARATAELIHTTRSCIYKDQKKHTPWRYIFTGRKSGFVLWRPFTKPWETKTSHYREKVKKWSTSLLFRQKNKYHQMHVKLGELDSNKLSVKIIATLSKNVKIRN